MGALASKTGMTAPVGTHSDVLIGGRGANTAELSPRKRKWIRDPKD